MGFGPRGTEGKIQAVRHERENSTEVDPNTPHPVIDLMGTQRGLRRRGGTMRLGAYPCVLEEGSLARRLYNRQKISERHRHRYEVNNAYRERLEKGGLVLSGVSPDGTLVEMIELATIPGSSRASFTPSSSRGRWSATRSSRASSRRPSRPAPAGARRRCSAA